MAPKAKTIASSCSTVVVESRMGGAPPQEAPISGKSLQMAFVIIMNTKRPYPLTSFWSFETFAEVEQSTWISQVRAWFMNAILALMSSTLIWWSWHFFALLTRPSRLRLNVSPWDSASWDFWTRVSFMRLAFESLDLEKFLSMKSRCRLHVGLTF